MKSLVKVPKIKKWDCAVLCAVLLLRIMIFAISRISTTPDSFEFIHMDGFQWMHGVLDRYRLPLYPTLIELCQRLSGGHSLKLLCIIQLFASLGGIVAMYALFKKLSDKPYVYLPLFAACCTTHVMSYWDNLILTESISLSLTAILLWALVCYIKEHKLRYIIIAIVTAGFGAFMRVIFAVYVGAIFVFLLLQLLFPGAEETKKLCRSNARKGLIVTAIPIVLILCYALAFSQQHGSFTLSHSGLGQQLYIVIEEGYYQDSSDEEIKYDIEHMLNTRYPGEVTDQEQSGITDQKYVDTLQAYFQKTYKSDMDPALCEPLFRIRCYLMQTYEPDRLSAFVSEAKAANLLSYLAKMPSNSMASFSANYTVFKEGKVYDWLKTIPGLVMNLPKICLLQALTIGAAELVVYAYLLLKKKSSRWIHLGFGAMIVATGVLSLFGTNTEFARTAITVYPMLFAVFVIWVNAAMDLILRRAQTSQQIKELS